MAIAFLEASATEAQTAAWLVEAQRNRNQTGALGLTVWFLRIGGKSVVVSVKGEERAELHPPVAELFVRVTVKAASISTEHWDAEQSKVQCLWDGEEHVRESGCIVAAPVSCPLARACEGAAADDEGTLFRDRSEKSLICRV